MNEEKMKQLLPFFAFLHLKKTKPEKYSNPEDLGKNLDENPQDLEEVITEAKKLTDAEWAEIEQMYAEQISSPDSEENIDTIAPDEGSTDQIEMVKKGAKLKKLQEYKKGKKMSKKCKCGCEMITSKEAGGKLVIKCACGCKNHKKEDGGKINEKVISLKLKKVPFFKQKKK